jgi:hypothetical protein
MTFVFGGSPEFRLLGAAISVVALSRNVQWPESGNIKYYIISVKRRTAWARFGASNLTDPLFDELLPPIISDSIHQLRLS